MVEHRVRNIIIIIIIIIVSFFLLEKEAPSKEISMSIQLGEVINYYHDYIPIFYRL